MSGRLLVLADYDSVAILDGDDVGLALAAFLLGKRTLAYGN